MKILIGLFYQYYISSCKIKPVFRCKQIDNKNFNTVNLKPETLKNKQTNKQTNKQNKTKSKTKNKNKQKQTNKKKQQQKTNKQKPFLGF